MSDLLGFTVAACRECGCGANSYHYPGCSGAPYVCPGCHAVASPCLPGCIDAEMEAEREARINREGYWSDYYWDEDMADVNGVEDWEYSP